MESNSKGFQVAVCADTAYGPYELMLQGNATQDALYFAPSEGKKALAAFDIGVRDNVWTMLGRAEGDIDKYNDRQELPFMGIKSFGYAATGASKVKKGRMVAVAGKISRREFPRKDGTQGEKVELIADTVVDLDESSPRVSNIVGVMTIHTDQNGVQQQSPCACCVDATVKKVGELNHSETGEAYVNLTLETVGCIDRAWDLANKCWKKEKEYKEHRLYATLWGTSAERLVEKLTEGTRVCVSGKMSQRMSNDGKTVFYGMRIWQLSRFLKPKNDTSAQPVAEEAPESGDGAEETPATAPAQPAPQKRTRKAAAKKPEPQPAPEPTAEEYPSGGSSDGGNGEDEELELPF